MSSRLIRLSGAVLLAVTTPLHNVHAAQETDGAAIAPVELVRDMSMALKTLNYEGTFVHLQGRHVTSMHILHSSDGGGEIERMVSLDGEAREVVRNHSLVTCIWPDSQAVVVTKSKPRQLLPNVDERLADNRRYDFQRRPDDRVAGLPTFVVEVLPMDRYRYGYRFWIDKETSMLLRSMLLDGPDQAVEQMMFTSIQYPEDIDPVRFSISPAEEQMSWLEPGVATARAGALESLQSEIDRVAFVSLPDGYVEVSETYRPMPLENRPVSHVMVSDGMASVSVYVEHVAPAAQDQSSSGLSSMGAMNAFGLSLPNGFVTVVGEVPASTVEAIAAAVQIRQ